MPQDREQSIQLLMQNTSMSREDAERYYDQQQSRVASSPANAGRSADSVIANRFPPAAGGASGSRGEQEPTPVAPLEYRREQPYEGLIAVGSEEEEPEEDRGPGLVAISDDRDQRQMLSHARALSQYIESNNGADGISGMEHLEAAQLLGQLTGQSTATALRNFGPLAKSIVPEGERESTSIGELWQALADGAKMGRLQRELAAIGSQILHGGGDQPGTLGGDDVVPMYSTPGELSDLEQRIQDLRDAMPRTNPQELPWVRRALYGVANQVTMIMGPNVLKGATGGMAAAAGGAAMAALSGAAVPASIIGGLYLAGQSVATMFNSAELTQGLYYLNIRDLEDENGNRIPDHLARSQARTIGAVSAAMEMLQPEALPGLGRVMNRLSSNAMKRTIYRGLNDVAVSQGARAAEGTLAGVLFRSAARSGVGTAFEIGVEVAQETLEIYGEELTKEIMNSEYGADFDPIAVEDYIEQMKNVVIDSALSFGVLGGVGGALELRQDIKDYNTAQIQRSREGRAERAQQAMEEEREAFQIPEVEDEARALLNQETEKLNDVLQRAQAGEEITDTDMLDAIRSEERIEALERDLKRRGIEQDTDETVNHREYEETESAVYQSPDYVRMRAQVLDPGIRESVRQNFHISSDQELDGALFVVDLMNEWTGVSTDELLGQRIQVTQDAEQFTREALRANPDQNLTPEMLRSKRGAEQFISAGRMIVYAGESADLTTFIHEVSHAIRPLLPQEILSQFEQEFRVEDGVWDRRSEELFARGLEEYMRSGRAPRAEYQGIFERIASWFNRVYAMIRKRWRLKPSLVAAYDRLLGYSTPSSPASPAKVVRGPDGSLAIRDDGETFTASRADGGDGASVMYQKDGNVYTILSAGAVDPTYRGTEEELMREFVSSREPGARFALASADDAARKLFHRTYDGPQGQIVEGDERLRFALTSEQQTVFQSTPLMTGEETLNEQWFSPSEDRLRREFGDEREGPTMRIARALGRRTEEKYGKIERGDYSEEAARQIAESIADEVEFEMSPDRAGDSGAGWYSEKYQRALDRLATAYPELATSQKARDLITALIAITSDGQKVMDNFTMAAEAYAQFRETGTFPETVGHIRSKSIEGNLAKIQDMVNRMGLDGMRDYLLEEIEYREINQAMRDAGKDAKGEFTASTVVPRSAMVFSAKLGMFYANLMGSSGYLTMDRWWNRTFNRYRGDLLQEVSGTQETGKNTGLQRYKRLAGLEGRDDAEVIGDLIRDRDIYKDANFKDANLPDGVDPSRVKAANTLYKQLFEELQDAPLGAAEREFMMHTVDVAQQVLSERGTEVSVADIQAILWYYEKRLYGELGARASADISYEEAAGAVAEAAAGSGPEGLSVSRGDDSRGTDALRLLTEGDRQEVANEVRKERGRRGGPNGSIPQLYSTGMGPGDGRSLRLASRDVAVRDQLSVDPAVAERFERAGIETPDFFELEPGQESAEAFHSLISESKQQNKYGASVYVYDTDEYAHMRTFVTEDGSSGFALKGDDIVSVFSTGGRRTGPTIVNLATQLGGRTLDAFDTVLPALYHTAGFRVVARMKWDDQFSPEGWDKQTFAKYNGGEPDVVFMVFDPENYLRYDGPEEGAMVDDYDEAVRLQQEAKWSAEKQTEAMQPYEALASALERNPGAKYAMRIGTGTSFMRQDFPDLNWVTPGRGRADVVIMERPSQRYNPRAMNEMLRKAIDSLTENGELVIVDEAEAMADRLKKAFKKADTEIYATSDELSGGLSQIIVTTHPQETQGQSRATLFQEDVARTPQFRAWFGDSQVVDDDGSPLVVYHGTRNQFSEFRAGRAGAMYFTDNAEYAKQYGDKIMSVYLKSSNLADLTDPSSDAYRIAVDAFNGAGGWAANPDSWEWMQEQGREDPMFDPEHDLTWEIFDLPEAEVDAALLRAGYDGMKLRERRGIDSYAVFHPTQIKSATNNVGTFDPANPSTLFQEEVFHGSTSYLEGFDADRVGAGSGQLLHGWGLYFSSDQEIAESTAIANMNRDIQTLGLPKAKTRNIRALWESLSERSQTLVRSNSKNYKPTLLGMGRALRELRRLEQVTQGEVRAAISRDLGRMERLIAESGTADPKRSLYEATLFAGKDRDEYTLLSWYDKVPDEQMLRIVERLDASGYPKLADWIKTHATIGDLTVEQMYTRMVRYMKGLDGSWMGGAKRASLFLNDTGIDGFTVPKFGAAGNRDYSQGTEYVIFNPEAVTIESHTLFQDGIDEENRDSARRAVDNGEYVRREVLEKWNQKDEPWAEYELFRRDVLAIEANAYSSEDEYVSAMLEAEGDFYSEEYYRQVYAEAELARQQAPKAKVDQRFVKALDHDLLVSLIDELVEMEADADIPLVLKPLADKVKAGKKVFKKETSEALKALSGDASRFRRLVERTLDRDNEIRAVLEEARTEVAIEERESEQQAEIQRGTTAQHIDDRITRYKAKLAVLEDALMSARSEARRGESDLRNRLVREKASAVQQVREEIRGYYKTKQQIEKMVRRMMRKPSKSINWKQAEMISQIQYSLRARPSERMERIKRIFRDSKYRVTHEAMEEILKLELDRKNVRTLPIEELEKIHDRIESLRTEGRAEYRQRVEAEKDMIRKARRAMMDTVGDPDEIVTGKGSREAQKRMTSSLGDKIQFNTLRPERIARMLDNNQQKVFYDWLWKKVNDATNEELRHIDRRLEEGRAKIEELGIKGRELGKRVTIDGYTYTIDDIISMYVGMQDEYSRDALRFGNRIPEYLINKFIDQLPQKFRDWGDWMVGSFSGENFDRLAEVFTQDANQPLKKVRRYFPMLRQEVYYDDLHKQVADDLLARSGVGPARTQHGFTTSRIKIAPQHQRPIRLGATAIWREQVTKQEHYISHGMLVKRMNRIFADRMLQEVLTKRYGDSAPRWIEKYVKDVAHPNIYDVHDTMRRTSQFLRQSVALGALAFNPITALKQLPSFAFYLPYSGPVHLLGSIGRFMVNPFGMIRRVREMDPQVKNRSYSRLTEEIKQLRKNKFVAGRDKIGRIGMGLIRAMDSMAVTIGWDAVYQRAKAEKKSEEEAVRLAQTATLITQPAARAKDVAQIYRSHEAYNWMLMFSNQLNQIWNMVTYDMFRGAPEGGNQLAHGLAVTFAVVLSSTVIGAIQRRRPQEDAEEVGEDLLSNLISAVPFIGSDVRSGLEGWFSSGVEPLPLANELGSFARSMSDEDRDTGEKMEAVGRLLYEAAMTAGVPGIVPARRSYRAFVEKLDGEVEDAYDLWVLLTGGPEED